MKKDGFVFTIFLLVLAFQLIFYHLPESVRIPFFLLENTLLITFLFQSKKIEMPKTITFLFLIYSAATIFSSFFSVYKFDSVIRILEISGIFSLIILAVNLLREKKRVDQLFWMLFITGSYLSINGILEFTGRVKMEFPMPLFEPFHWPQLSASFFLLLFPILFIYFLNSKGEGIRKLTLFFFLFLVTEAWILSRSNLLFLIILGLALIAAHLYSNRLSWMAIYKKPAKGLILLSLLLAMTLPNFFSSFGSTLIPQDSALFQNNLFFQENNDIMRFSSQSIRDHFWEGIGPGNFGSAYHENLVKPWTWANFASSELLQTFVETGIFGFFSELLIFLYLVFSAVKKIILFMKNRDLTALALGMIVFSFIILSLVSASFRSFPLVMVFFLFASLLLKNKAVFKIDKNYFYFLIAPVLLISLILSFDGFLLRNAQRAFVRKNYTQAEGLIKMTNKRPDFLTNQKNFYLLSNLEAKNKNWPQAIMYLEKGKLLNPLDQETNYQIAQIKFNEGQFDEAKNILNDSVTKNPFLPPYYYLALYDANKNLRKEEEGLSELVKIKEIYPESDIYKMSQHTLEANEFYPVLESIYSLISKQKN